MSDINEAAEEDTDTEEEDVGVVTARRRLSAINLPRVSVDVSFFSGLDGRVSSSVNVGGRARRRSRTARSMGTTTATNVRQPRVSLQDVVARRVSFAPVEVRIDEPETPRSSLGGERRNIRPSGDAATPTSSSSTPPVVMAPDSLANTPVVATAANDIDTMPSSSTASTPVAPTPSTPASATPSASSAAAPNSAESDGGVSRPKRRAAAAASSSLKEPALNKKMRRAPGVDGVGDHHSKSKKGKKK